MQLSQLDFPQEIISLLKTSGISELNPPQIAAVKAGLLENKNLVIATPTASGKTLIAELAFIRNFLNNGKTIYLVPLKALASEKYREFKEKYEKIGMRIAISIGDLDSDDSWLRTYDLIIASNEKMDSLLRHAPDWIGKITLIIADEVHLINDPSRGPTLEVVLTRLRDLTKSQILALSATIQNADEIAEWLDAKLVKSDYRPVKLHQGIFYPDGSNSKIEFLEKEKYILEGSNQNENESALSADTLSRNKQALMFLSTRASAEAAAEKISKVAEKFISKEEKEKLAALSNEALNALSNPTKQCKRLASLLKSGVAFHHAGLVAKQRQIIEDNFRNGIIKILTATPTLSFGLNLPAWRVLIRDTKRYGGYGSEYIPILEVHQMCVPGDTEVMMGDGSCEKIEDVIEKLNTAIMSVDPNFGVESRKIIKKYSRYTTDLIKLRTVSGKELSATPEHPILVLADGAPKWIPVKKICSGYKVGIVNRIPSLANRILFIEMLDDTIYIENAKSTVRHILKKGKITYKRASEYLNIPFKTMKSYGYNKSIPLKHIKRLSEIASLDSNSLAEILDGVRFKTKHGAPIKLPKHMDKKFAWFVGLVAAEGSIVNYVGHGRWKGVKYSKLKLANTNEKIINKLEVLLRKLGIAFYKRRYKGGFTGSRIAESIEISNQTLINILNRFGIYSGKKSYTLRAINLFSMTDEIVAGYLAGAFDGDGNVSKAPSVRLSSMSRLFLKDCKGLLLRFGIRSSVTKEKECYTLTISGKTRINKFFMLIPCIRLENKELKYIKMTRPEINMGDIYFEKVTSIESIKLKEPMKVFNISVDSNENYICNDFIVHNCGRAGRPKYDTDGEAILMAKTKTETKELWERYILGEPEPIYSKLSIESVLRMHVLSLVACEAAKTMQHLQDFFSKTFFAHQYKDINEVMEKVGKILKELESYDFIKTESGFISDEFVPAFNIGKGIKLEATRLGKRVSELYLDPQSAHRLIENLKVQSDMNYLLAASQCVEMKPLLTVKQKEAEWIEDALASSGLVGPDVWDIDYEDFLKSFKASLMFTDWMSEIGEDKLLEKYGITPGELYAKTTTAEWIFYAMAELAKLLNKRLPANAASKIKLRIRYGVKEELLPLVRLRSIGRARARLLFRNGIKNISDIKKAQLEKLETVLGKNIAKQLKEITEENLDEKMKRFKF